tara:strand:- start:659 stop:979 length:321 start_codon:yes stop_codon:yes gene_type:complete
MKRNLISDPTTGKEINLHQESDGSSYIEQTQRFDNLLKINKHMADDWKYGQMRGTQKHMAHVAEIPNILYAELVQKFGKPADNPKAWKQWLNDSENRAFRTGGGKL